MQLVQFTNVIVNFIHKMPTSSHSLNVARNKTEALLSNSSEVLALRSDKGNVTTNKMTVQDQVLN